MKSLKYIAFAFAAALSFQSCDLERYPLTDLSEENFWTDEQNAQYALTYLYRNGITVESEEYNPSDIWSYHGMLLMEHLTDNGYDRRGENNPFFQITSGKLMATNNFVNRYWVVCYKRISNCNRFIEGLSSASDSQNNRRMLAEARVLRAAMYHYLASYFQDVPLVTTVLSGEETNNVKKETRDNILKFCATEIEAAAKDIPTASQLPASEGGRLTRQAALAFLGRVKMLQKDWNGGAEVYKQIMDLGENSIHPSYSELFLPGTGVTNKENLFYIQYIENYFGMALPHLLSAKDGGWSLSNPSAGLYEAYEFTDGTPFSYDDPRYNPDNLGENRDPRLDYTIYYNGATFKGTEYKIGPDYQNKERLDYGTEASRTGFMWRKYFNEEPVTNISSNNMVTPVLRYAEVLLSYLECLIEAGKPINQGVLDQTINAVRGRADVHMPAITETNPDKLREIVRHERRIELAYEGIRLWDIFRWKIADQVLVGEIWGAPYPNSTTYATSTKQVDPTGHYRWYVGRRDFRSPQDYKWPIPESEQNINPNLRD